MSPLQGIDVTFADRLWEHPFFVIRLPGHSVLTAKNILLSRNKQDSVEGGWKWKQQFIAFNLTLPPSHFLASVMGYWLTIFHCYPDGRGWEAHIIYFVSILAA